MTLTHTRRPSWYVVAVAALIAISAVAVRGHVPARPDLLTGTIGAAAAWAVAVVVLGTALFVAARPAATRISHRRPSIRRLVVIGFCLLLLAEFGSVYLPIGGDGPAVIGVSVALVLLAMRGYLGVETDPPAGEPFPDDAGDSLQRWVFRTETLIHRSATSRADWDRHVRPIVARQFEMATKANQRRATDPEAFKTTGKMLFGDELWQWVDPDNVVRGGARRPGPGRQTLEGILDCLERV